MPPFSVNQSDPHNRMHDRTISRAAAFLLPAVALLGALVIGPRSAIASDGEARIWGQLGAANAHGVGDDGQWGPTLQLGAAAGITDFWVIAGGIEGSYHFAENADDIPSHEVVGLFAGFRYNLDIFKYVPYLGLSLVNYFSRPPFSAGDEGGGLGAKLSVGVDWRYDRNWSAGGMIELHAPLSDPADFPIYSTIGINLSYHFRL